MIARVFTLALLLAVPAAAQAQDEAEARRLFEEGTRAVQDAAWRDAIALLERSLAASARSATAFNLALALEGDGQLLRALEVCEGVIEGTYGAIDDEHREEAAARCQQISGAIAVVDVTVGGAPSIELRVDGETIAEVADGASHEARVDPGRHVLSVRAPDRVGEERTLELERGARSALSLRVNATGGDDAIALGVGLGAGAAALVVVAIIVGVVVGGQGLTFVEGNFPTVEVR